MKLHEKKTYRMWQLSFSICFMNAIQQYKLVVDSLTVRYFNLYQHSHSIICGNRTSGREKNINLIDYYIAKQRLGESSVLLPHEVYYDRVRQFLERPKKYYQK
jgi:hypothetical protein